MVFDLVCGRAIPVTERTPRARFEGSQRYFCSPQCKERFKQRPERFAHRAVLPMRKH